MKEQLNCEIKSLTEIKGNLDKSRVSLVNSNIELVPAQHEILGEMDNYLYEFSETIGWMIDDKQEKLDSLNCDEEDFDDEE